MHEKTPPVLQWYIFLFKADVFCLRRCLMFCLVYLSSDLLLSFSYWN